MKPCSLYVHIPFCKSKCAYCDFFSVVCKNNIDDAYIQKLLDEAEKRAVQFDVSAWNTVYFGGGTPSLLTAAQIKALISGLKAVRPIAENAEITFECNPDDITIELLHALSENGVNRLSVGLQSMQNEPLAIVNRRAGRAENLRAIELISKYWLDSPENDRADVSLADSAHTKHRFSVDLICGLPGETCESFFDGLDEVIHCGADHVSLYSLTLEEDTPLYNAVDSGRVELPEIEETDSWWIKARDILEENGFEQYEVSNFAKKGCQSRHNMTYWKMQPYIGIGAGATGTAGSLRYTNSRSIKDWLNGSGEEQEVLTPDIQKFEFLMMGFRTLEGADISEFERRFNEKIDVIEPVFSKWCKKGLAKRTKNLLALNKEGLLLLNCFLKEIMDFFEKE